MAAGTDGALGWAGAVRRREVSPVELVERCLAGIAARPELAAFVAVSGEQARERAKLAEVAVTLRDDPDGLPVLHGVPTALKDLTDTAGVPTSWGSAAFAGRVPTADAQPARRLAEAGLVSVGKTATSEFGATLYTETDLGPPTANPWRDGLSPGGSSGGAAAAVAAGLVPVAVGSDGGGSLRIPAALCGVIGLKPGRGTLPGPSGDRGFGLSTDGALGRSVDDVAALLDVLAGTGTRYLRASRRPTGRLRVARCVTPPLADVTVHPDCLAAVDRVAGTLADLGHDVVDLPAPLDASVLPDFHAVWSALVGGVPVPRGREPLLRPLTRWLRESAGDPRPAADRLAAAAGRATRALAGHDVILTPTLAAPSAPIGRFAALDPPDDFAAQTALSPYCTVFNLTGQPAVSLPLGRTGDGLPVGVQLAAPAGADGRLLAVARVLEEHAGGTYRTPPPGRSYAPLA